MPFREEDKVGWHELAPSVQKLFRDGLDKHIQKSRQDLNDEIEREKAAIEKIKNDIINAINKYKSDQFGLAGVKGRVVKHNLGQPMYCDDHFFNIATSQGNKDEWLYEYNFTTGKYKDKNGVVKDIPYRSFLYNADFEKLWYYWEPGRFEEIKWRYVKKTVTMTTNPINLLTSGFDTYDQHIRYYKIYDNGWCEQVGAYSHYNPDMEVDDRINYFNRYVKLKIPYKDTNYIITIGGEIWPETARLCTHGYGIYLKEKNRFRPSICGNQVNVHWRYSTYHAAGFVDLKALGFNV